MPTARQPDKSQEAEQVADPGVEPEEAPEAAQEAAQTVKPDAGAKYYQKLGVRPPQKYR